MLSYEVCDRIFGHILDWLEEFKFFLHRINQHKCWKVCFLFELNLEEFLYRCLIIDWFILEGISEEKQYSLLPKL